MYFSERWGRPGCEVVSNHNTLSWRKFVMPKFIHNCSGKNPSPSRLKERNTAAAGLPYLLHTSWSTLLLSCLTAADCTKGVWKFWGLNVCLWQRVSPLSLMKTLRRVWISWEPTRTGLHSHRSTAQGPGNKSARNQTCNRANPPRLCQRQTRAFFFPTNRTSNKHKAIAAEFNPMLTRRQLVCDGDDITDTE